MGLIDEQPGKQPIAQALFDRFGDLDRLFRIALWVFVSSVLLTPVVIYFNFAYFTAKAAPWWLEVVTALNISAFLLGGLAILVLGLAKLMASRRD